MKKCKLIVLMFCLVFLGLASQAKAAPALEITNYSSYLPTNFLSQYTTFGGATAFYFNIKNNSGDYQTVTNLSFTPSGTVDDTKITLSFFKEFTTNANGIVDKSDTDLGGSGSFSADNAKTKFDIDDIIIPPEKSVNVFVVAKGSGLNGNSFTVSIEDSSDISIASGLTTGGTFPVTSGTLVLNDTVPVGIISDGVEDPADRYSDGKDELIFKQLKISNTSNTADSLKSLGLILTGGRFDIIESMQIYIDYGGYYVAKGIKGQIDENDIVLDYDFVMTDESSGKIIFQSPLPVVKDYDMNLLFSYDLKDDVVINNGDFPAIGRFSNPETGSGIGLTGSTTDTAKITIYRNFSTDLTAENVTISGTPKVGQTLTGEYDLIDNNPGGWAVLGNADFSEDAANSTSMALNSNNIPYVGYTDSAHGEKATVMKLNGDTWEVVGTAGFSSGFAGNLSFALSLEDVPYVAYANDLSKATVMKLNGDTWEVVGTTGFSDGKIDRPFLAFDKENVPYISYTDNANNGKATVMKFNGTSWKYVGTAGFSAESNVYDTSMAFDSHNTPYVAFRGDKMTGGKATVMKFNGATWIDVGNINFSENAAEYIKIKIDSNDIPYVAYSNAWSGDGKSVVMKLNGGTNTWEVVGTAGFSAGIATSISFDIKNGIPYVAYVDGANDGHATVMKFNGTSWEVVGTAGFSSGKIGNPSLVVDSSNNIYLACSDSDKGEKATVMKFTITTIKDNSTYQWYRDGEEITGATEKTYTTTSSDGGKNISFEVTPISVDKVGVPVESDEVTISASTNDSSVHHSSGSYLPGYGTNKAKPIVTPTTREPIKGVLVNLSFGMKGPNVKILQDFLVKQAKGPAAQALAKHGTTDYFGKLTKAALAEWQKVNNIKPSVGFFGPLTRAFIAEKI